MRLPLKTVFLFPVLLLTGLSTSGGFGDEGKREKGKRRKKTLFCYEAHHWPSITLNLVWRRREASPLLAVLHPGLCFYYTRPCGLGLARKDVTQEAACPPLVPSKGGSLEGKQARICLPAVWCWMGAPVGGS